MKNLINYKTIIYCMVLIGLAFSGCKEDDKPEPDPVDTTSQDTTVSCNAFAKTIEENPASNMILGTLDGSSNKGSVTFSLLTEVPTGAFTVDATSGELSVADNSLFTIATNPTLTGTFAVQNGSETTNCTITITLKDTVSSDLPDCGEDPEYSKVYDGAVQLKSQEDIDSFTSSGWTEVTGRVLISGGSITDLSGLRSLTKVGDLSIWRLTISDLQGLCNLQEIIGGLEIESNSGLTSLKGLERLKSIGSELEIASNGNLEDVSALSNLELIGYASGGTFEYANITIQSNAKLTSLNGLGKISETRELRVIENPLLTSLDGLGSILKAKNVFVEQNSGLLKLDELKIEEITGKLVIDENSSLTSVDINALVSAGSIIINENNALLDVTGFSKLTTLGNYAMFKNTGLTTISGFNNVMTIGTGGTVNKFYVNNNQALTSITGFTKLKNIQGGFGINECRKLTDISSLIIEDIEGSLTVAYTDLTSLTGLGNLTAVGPVVAIRKNPKLTDFCALKALVSGSGFTGTWAVTDNSANPTKADVLGNCP